MLHEYDGLQLNAPLGLLQVLDDQSVKTNLKHPHQLAHRLPLYQELAQHFLQYNSKFQVLLAFE